MRRIHFLALCILGTFISCPIVRAANPATQPSTNSDQQAEINNLRSRIIQLKTENAALKAELETLKQHSSVDYFKPYRLDLNPPLGQTPQPNPNGYSYQFNGRTVYVEPLATTWQSAGTIAVGGGNGAITIKPRADLIDNRPASQK
jgi:hypothetical protein